MPAQRHRIACIDDDETIRDIVEVALADIGGFEVRLYISGQQALERLGNEPPDLILLDLIMPGLDGLETMARLREQPRFAHTPIVMMTARAQAHEVDAYMALGAAGAISKPFNPMTLANNVRSIWSALPEVAMA
jgi:two-component system, OmpR family, response regulator